MNIGEPRRMIVIEPIEEPKWVAEPEPTEPLKVPEPERKAEPVPA